MFTTKQKAVCTVITIQMSIIPIGFLLVLLSTGRAQDRDCDVIQPMVLPNRTYYIYSPNYPNYYTGGVQCRWQATCPIGYNCRLVCTDINLPETPSCYMDRLLVSKTGDPQLASAEYYCGLGTLNITSQDRKLSVGLVTSYQSPGGRFVCELTAQRVPVIPPTCQCGYRKLNRIVGGQETGINEFPMMAGIAFLNIIAIKCGGVIISKRYVLTAAHCVAEKTVNEIAVVVGEHDVTSAESPATRAYAVTSIELHPLYNKNNNDNDISILRVAQDILFSDRVGPVCLPFKYINSDFAGDKVTILGWGTLSPGGPTSPTLQKVNVNVISQPACRRRVSSVTPRQLCTLTPGKDACQDDSGGPLLYTEPSTGRLYSVGIVSYGTFCASNFPAINTRVTMYLDWIVAVTQENFCKI